MAIKIPNKAAPAAAVEEQSGQAETSVQNSKTKTTVTGQAIVDGTAVQLPADKLARVKVSVGMTVNMGDYNSARVDASIDLPCHVDDVGNTFSLAREWAENKVNAMVEELGKE